MATQIEVLQSAPFLERAHKLANQRTQGARAAAPQDESIRVAVVENTNVIRLPRNRAIRNTRRTWRTRSSKSTARIAADQRRAGPQRLNDGVEQAEAVKAKLDRSEAALGKFKRTHRTEDLQRQQEARKQAYLDLQEKAREADFNLALGGKRRKAEMEMTSSRRVASVTKVYEPNPEYTRLVEKVAGQEEKVDGLKEQFQDGARRCGMPRGSLLP